jgi:hypothetical protein
VSRHIAFCLIPLLLVSPALAQETAPILIEAEEFQPQQSGDAQWRRRKWGENYYAATLANTFLSRKAFLGAPEQAEAARASLTVQVPKAGRYLALVRYEAAYRFQTQFRLLIEQNGHEKLSRLYGARENIKIWAFGRKLAKEVAWDWGAGENIVWEGHDASIDLAAGPARLTLIADKQPTPAAQRNVDAIMLTTDADDVTRRIDKEGYLPLDGLLTQADDLYLRVHPRGQGKLTVDIPPATEHSPYWVHQRRWKPRRIEVEAARASDWTEVGSLLDSLNDGQWKLSIKGDAPCDLEFAAKHGDAMKVIRRFDAIEGDLELAYDADTRYTDRIRKTDEVLYELLEHLRASPVPGRPPTRTLVYGHTFHRRQNDDRYNVAVDDFRKLIGASALAPGRTEELEDASPLVRGYIDLRGRSPEQLKAEAETLRQAGRAQKIAVVSLGDEIGLEQPKATDLESFKAWLRQQRVENPDDIAYTPDRRDDPRSFYWSRRYRNAYGIARQKELTDALRAALPSAGIGANFSPHHGKNPYLGEVNQWVTLFRRGGMTMPWSEDYIWQVPVGTQQMNFLNLDLFRAGVRGTEDKYKIHQYVMPHWPGNTPSSWRRLFYGSLGHGAKVLNLFEFRPVQAAYTENHVSSPAMYQEVRKSLHELGTFEDIIQDGKVRSAPAALFFGETGDIWDNQRHPFGPAKRSLYIAIRHQQLPLDLVTEDDATAEGLKPYRVLYLTDRNVNRAASTAIANWVAAGNTLFATAGAGMRDEYDAPNTLLMELLGIADERLEEAGDPVRLEKQDLPFAAEMDIVKCNGSELPVINVRSRVAAAAGAAVEGTFRDGSPAVLRRKAGNGQAIYAAFLPGLTYFKPAIPLRPVDRGTRDDSMAHFIPTKFHKPAGELIAAPAAAVKRPVTCSEPLVETCIIESPHGVAVVLINWSTGPRRSLRLTLDIPIPDGHAILATGGPVRRDGDDFILDLDVADALLLSR